MSVQDDKRVLNFLEAQALLKTPMPDATKSTRWINVADRRALLAAIDDKANVVYLPTTGRKFKITYKFVRGEDHVWISQPDTIAPPCALITVSRLRTEVGKDRVIATL